MVHRDELSVVVKKWIMTTSAKVHAIGRWKLVSVGCYYKVAQDRCRSGVLQQEEFGLPHNPSKGWRESGVRGKRFVSLPSRYYLQYFM
jgi:hypothetical protein